MSLFAITAILIALKVGGVLDISWLGAFAPALIAILFFIFMCIMASIASNKE